MKKVLSLLLELCLLILYYIVYNLQKCSYRVWKLVFQLQFFSTQWYIFQAQMYEKRCLY